MNLNIWNEAKFLTEIMLIFNQNELFQDDLFPPTRVTWIPTLTPSDWFNCRDKKVKKISLQPEGMECCKFFFIDSKKISFKLVKFTFFQNKLGNNK